MRPTGVEPATFGLKDRRSLAPRKEPLTTELRAPEGDFTRAAGFERFRGGGAGGAGACYWPGRSSPARIFAAICFDSSR